MQAFWFRMFQGTTRFLGQLHAEACSQYSRTAVKSQSEPSEGHSQRSFDTRTEFLIRGFHRTCVLDMRVTASRLHGSTAQTPPCRVFRVELPSLRRAVVGIPE